MKNLIHAIPAALRPILRSDLAIFNLRFFFFVRLYWGWQLIQSGWGKLHHLGQRHRVLHQPRAADARANGR